jgi:hypothetical protein
MHHQRDALTLLKGGGQRFIEARGRAGCGGETVDHHEQLLRPGEIEARRQVFEMVRSAVRHNANEPERQEIFRHARVGQPGDRREREADLDRPNRPGQRVSTGRLGGIATNRASAQPAITLPDPGPEQPQVVVDLGRRPHSRPAGDHRIALLDGDRRREPLQPVHQGLRHPVEELLCVGG